MKQNIFSKAVLAAGLLLALADWHCKKKNDTLKGYELTITAISPDAGRPGTQVSVRGQGFSPVLNENLVKFNDKPAEVLHASDSLLLVVAPEEGSSGPVSVSVNDQFQTGPVFTYTGPVIKRLNPVQLETSGNRNLSIEGERFGTDPQSTRVMIGGLQAFILVLSDTLINVTTPNLPVGTFQVNVEVNGQTSNSVPLDFYND
jgi:hypothetical protein